MEVEQDFVGRMQNLPTITVKYVKKSYDELKGDVIQLDDKYNDAAIHVHTLARYPNQVITPSLDKPCLWLLQRGNQMETHEGTITQLAIATQVNGERMDS